MTLPVFTPLLILMSAIYVQRCFCVNLNTLRLVQVVYRHGDRAPLITYPNDPYKDVENYWPNGFGQLTDKGVDQHYDLGRYIRERYDGFIDRRYDKKQIHVLSSDTDRTLMSAEANLAGLFPKLTTLSRGQDNVLRNIPKAKVDVQLVPIHTLMLKSDKLLHMSVICPRRDQALDEYKKSSHFIQKLKRENEGLFKYVKEKTGVTTGTDIFSLTRITDVLYCQQLHNLTLPSWANSSVVEKMRELSGISFSLKGGTPELRRLHGGPLAQRLLDNMDAHTSWKKHVKPKIYMHSAHDSTLAAIMNTFGVFYPQNPTYASVFIADLHQEESTGKYFVELFYRNTTDHEPYPLNIPGCGSPCYLTQMQALMASYIPNDWEAECQQLALSNYSDSETEFMYHPVSLTKLLYFLGVIIVVVLLWATFSCLANRRRNIISINGNDSDPFYNKKASYVQMH